MANTRFQAKRTSTSGLLPNTTNSGNLSYIAAGEFAVNLTDKKVLSSNGTLTFEVGANLTSLSVGSAFTANSLGAYHTGTVNAASLTVGTSFIGNTTGAYHTGTMNAASLTVGTAFVANSTQVSVLASSFTVNSTIVQTNDDFRFNVNNKALQFATVNASAYARFTQQSDDNFVFYTTNTTYGDRAVWSIFANSITSNLNFSVPVNFTSNVGIGTVSLTANGTTGSAGQVLHSNGTATYWATATAVATVNVAGNYTWTNSHTWTSTANATFDSIATANNGSGTNVKIGDDVWLGDINTADTLGVRGQQSANNGYIVFGNADTTTKLGRAGLGALTYNGPFSLTGNLSVSTINATSWGATLTSNTTTALLTIGNSSVSATINGTTFSGSANNADFLDGQHGAYYTTNSSLSTYVSAMSANNTTYVNGKTEGNLNVNSATTASTANNTSFLGGTAAAGYQTTAGLSANVATLSANNTTYLNGQLAAYYTNATNITTGTLPAGQLPALYLGTTTIQSTSAAQAVSGITTLAAGNTTITGFANVSTSVNTALLTIGTAFVANTTGAYHTGTMNAASFTVGATFTANATLVNTAAINVTGQVNTATLYATTSANIASAVQVNATGIWTTGTVNAAVISTGSGFIANATQITIGTGFELSTNGSVGTAGQVLTSNGSSGSPYWSTISGGLIAGNGLTSNATHYAVNPGTGIVANATGTHVSGAVSGVTTLAAGNTTVTGFANVSTSVNSALLTVGTSFIANTTGAYHTGTMNAASFTTTGLRVNATAIVPTSNSSGQTLGNTISRFVITANSVTASGDVTAFSDVTLKNDIVTIAYALDKVNNMRGVSYVRKDYNDGLTRLGVIAQEIEKILPEVVTENADGIKAVNYSGIIPVLIEAIKELSHKVDILESKYNDIASK